MDPGAFRHLFAFSFWPPMVLLGSRAVHTANTQRLSVSKLLLGNRVICIFNLGGKQNKMPN